MTAASLSPEDKGRSRHRIVMAREWSDEEPDTLRVEVQTNEDEGRAFVTFTCSSTWLDAATVRDEVVPWLLRCAEAAESENASGAER